MEARLKHSKRVVVSKREHHQSIVRVNPRINEIEYRSLRDSAACDIPRKLRNRREHLATVAIEEPPTVQCLLVIMRRLSVGINGHRFRVASGFVGSCKRSIW